MVRMVLIFHGGHEEVAKGGWEGDELGFPIEADALLGVLGGGGHGEDKVGDGASARVKDAEAAVLDGDLADAEGMGEELLDLEEVLEEGADELVGGLGEWAVSLLPVVCAV